MCPSERSYPMPEKGIPVSLLKEFPPGLDPDSVSFPDPEAGHEIVPAGNGDFYHVDGQPLARVTNIIKVLDKPVLDRWMVAEEKKSVIGAACDLYEEVAGAIRAGNMKEIMGRAAFLDSLQTRTKGRAAHEKKMTAAGEIGTQVHDAIEWMVRKKLGWPVGEQPEVSAEARVAIESWKQWAKEVQFRPVMMERRVWHSALGYAGRFDMLAWVKGRLLVVDYKTGKGLYDEYWLQNAAYQGALEERGIPCHGGLLVRCPKDPSETFEEKEVPYFVGSREWEVWMATLKAWRWWSEKAAESDAAYRAKNRKQGPASKTPAHAETPATSEEPVF